MKPPDQGQRTFYGDTLKGFGVRVSQGGTKSFVLVHGENRRRTTLGRYPLILLADAGKKAKTLLAERTLNPEFPTVPFNEALEQFLKLHYRQNRASTRKETERLLRRHFAPLMEHPLAEITTYELTAIIDGLMKTPSEANHAFTAVRTFLRWCLGRRYLPFDPMGGLRKPSRPVSRSRVLSDEELACVLKAARGEGLYGQLVQFLAHTGQRTGQAVRLHGDMVDWEANTVMFPPVLMKTGKEHSIPLLPRAAELLPRKEGLLFQTDGGKIFSNWSTAKQRFDKACPLPHWTLHDLRRTFATGHARLGTAPHVVERMLAHSAGTVSGVAAINNRYSYLDEMREALGGWEAYLDQLYGS